jgi:hypothetical protein
MFTLLQFLFKSRFLSFRGRPVSRSTLRGVCVDEMEYSACAIYKAKRSSFDCGRSESFEVGIQLECPREDG